MSSFSMGGRVQEELRNNEYEGKRERRGRNFYYPITGAFRESQRPFLLEGNREKAHGRLGGKKENFPEKPNRQRRSPYQNARSVILQKQIVSSRFGQRKGCPYLGEKKRKEEGIISLTKGVGGKIKGGITIGYLSTERGPVSRKRDGMGPTPAEGGRREGSTVISGDRNQAIWQGEEEEGSPPKRGRGGKSQQTTPSSRWSGGNAKSS